MNEAFTDMGWRDVSLTDVLSKIIDNRGRSCPTASEGFPLIATNCIKADRLYPTFENVRFISEETKDSWFRGHPAPGDVIFVCKGSPGRVALTPSPVPFAIAQDMVALRANPAVIDERFLFYVLRSPQVQQRIASMHVGSLIPHFKKGDFPKLKFWIPISLSEQRRIAGVLGALDDLIEVNRGLIEDLDSALLASWDSVAGESVDLIAVGDKVEIRKGLSYKGAFLREEGLPMINMGSFGVDGKYRKSGLKWYDESQVKERNLLVKDDLVVVNTDLTQSCDILARPILVPFERATSTHHTFQVRVPGDSSEKFWIYCALRHERVRKSLASHATGTTVAALPAQTLLSQEIPWADSDTILSWWKTTEPLHRASLELSEENEELIQTRDELLPLLLSGRVRVGDVAA